MTTTQLYYDQNKIFFIGGTQSCHDTIKNNMVKTQQFQKSDAKNKTKFN